MTDPQDFGPLASNNGGDLADLIDVFRDPPARFAVWYVMEHEVVPLDELADAVTGWTHADAGGVASPADRDRIRIRLYHVTLPRLADLGVLAFDPDEKVVRHSDRSRRLQGFFRWVRQGGLSGSANGHG